MGFLVILLGLPVTTSGFGSGAATSGSAFVAGSASVASSATGSVSGVTASGFVAVFDSGTGGKSKGTSGFSVVSSFLFRQSAPFMFGRRLASRLTRARPGSAAQG